MLRHFTAISILIFCLGNVGCLENFATKSSANFSLSQPVGSTGTGGNTGSSTGSGTGSGGNSFVMNGPICSTSPKPVPTANNAADGTPILFVDVSSARHGISKDIYGINNYGTNVSGLTAFTAPTPLPVQRIGGDGTTRYNWLTDNSNSGGDWSFIGGTTPFTAAGATYDSFIQTNISAGTKSLVTIPIINYINKCTTACCTFDSALYPNQQSFNPYVHNCGNGIETDGTTPIVSNPLVINIANSSSFQKAWVQHIVGKFGNAASGGVQIYQMDNEPSGWLNTHRDIHPAATGYDELKDRTVDYASMIKAVDPTASVLGPSDFDYAV